EVSFAHNRRVESDGLPTIFPDRAGAEHSVILAMFLCGGIGCGVEGIAHRDAGERILLDASVSPWHLKAEDVQDGWNDVHGVMILVADLAARLDAFGPADDERVARAAGVFGVALEHFEWGRKGGGPAGGVVFVGVRSTHLIY